MHTAINKFSANDQKPSAQTSILIQLALPVILSQVSHTFVGLADTLMVGRTGNVTALAASALGNNIFSIPIVFAVGLSYAVTPKVSEFLARGDGETCHKFLRNSLINNQLWALILMAILFLLLPFSGTLGQAEEVLQLAVPFFKLQVWSLPGIMLFQTFRQFFDGLGDTKPGMVVSIAANLLNVLLNYLLIFGNFGFPELGLFGAGISNCISRWIMGIGMMVWYFLDPKMKEWRKLSLIRTPDIGSIRLLNQLGLPVALQFLFEVGAFSFTSVLVGQMGKESLAAHQIVISIASFTYMMSSGIAAASSIRVGHFLGLKNQPMLRYSGVLAFRLAAVFMGSMAFLMYLGSAWIPSLFISNAEVLKIGSQLFLVAAFFQVSDGIQVVGLGSLRGISDVRIPTWITLVAYWVIAIPLGYYLGSHLGWGAAGTWWALLVGLSISAIFMLFRFLSLTKSIDFTQYDEQHP
jgi:MATE family multidrug resistance protein